MKIGAIESDFRMSQAVVANGFVFLAGQVAKDATVNVEDQTRQVLGAIDALLAAAGTSKDRIVTATVYLSDISSFGEMNRAWDAWVSKTSPPARATVEAKLAGPLYRVEIQIIAVL